MICKTCNTEKPKKDFSRLKSRRSGIIPHCKICHNKKMKLWNKKHPFYSRNSNLMKNYGITSDDYDKMLKEQNNVCKVCNGPAMGKGRYHVDHCHKTGKIRGLLCHKCNVALGMVQDNIEHLNKLIVYLGTS